MANFFDDYARQTAEKIIEQLKAGTAPWQRSWEDGFNLPTNAVTGVPYRGMNMLLLMEMQVTMGFNDPRWLTFKQAQSLGGHVKKGATGVKCVFWSFKDKKTKMIAGNPDDPEAEEKVVTERRAIPCAFTVFNADQCEGLDLAPQHHPAREWTPVEAAERILKGSGADIRNVDQSQAFYSPKDDNIVLPLQEQFKSASDYYDTALHELGHWTGHPSRLNRDMSGHFGTESYAREELRAEISSMMTAGQIGLPHNTESHASYVKSWIKVLKEDPKEIFRAAADASKISEMLLEFRLEEKRGYFVDFDKNDVSRITTAELEAKARKFNPDFFDRYLTSLEHPATATDEDRSHETCVKAAAKRVMSPADLCYEYEATKHRGAVFAETAEEAVEAALWDSDDLARKAARTVLRFEGKDTADKALSRARDLAAAEGRGSFEAEEFHLNRSTAQSNWAALAALKAGREDEAVEVKEAQTQTAVMRDQAAFEAAMTVVRQRSAAIEDAVKMPTQQAALHF